MGDGRPSVWRQQIFHLVVTFAGNGPFWAKSWPGAFWSQILAIWRLPGRQVKPPSGTIGKRPVLGQILAGSLLEPNFGNLAASGPQLKPPSGTIGKRPVLGQILAGSLLEPNFGTLAASGPQLKPPSGTIGKRPVLGQILAGSLLEPNFGNLAASGPQLKPPSGTIGKRPVLGQILAGSLLEPNFGNLAASGPQLKPPSDYWETARFGAGREPFGAKFWQFGGFRAAIKTAIGKRPVLGNRLLGAAGKPARFGSNPGREPFFGTLSSNFGSFDPGREPRFGIWRLLGRFKTGP